MWGCLSVRVCMRVLVGVIALTVCYKSRIIISYNLYLGFEKLFSASVKQQESK